MQTVKFRKVHSDAQIPQKSHLEDACFDVVATSIEDKGDGRIVYGTGLAMELPEGTRLDLRPRSSIHKTGLILSYGIGTGDEGYTGEYKLVFYNVLPNLPNYEVGDRIIQVCVDNRNDVKFEEVGELEETVRGDGGLGSTGK